jgi:hypothetical protein
LDALNKINVLKPIKIRLVTKSPLIEITIFVLCILAGTDFCEQPISVPQNMDSVAGRKFIFPSSIPGKSHRTRQNRTKQGGTIDHGVARTVSDCYVVSEDGSCKACEQRKQIKPQNEAQQKRFRQTDDNGLTDWGAKTVTQIQNDRLTIQQATKNTGATTFAIIAGRASGSSA